MSSFNSGCLPIILGKEHRYFAFSKSTFSIDNPFGIDTFFKFSFSFFFLDFFDLFWSNSPGSISYCKYGPNLPFLRNISLPKSFLPINFGSAKMTCWDAYDLDYGLVNLQSG